LNIENFLLIIDYSISPFQGNLEDYRAIFNFKIGAICKNRFAIKTFDFNFVYFGVFPRYATLSGQAW